nr:LysR family transcriptional regulator [Marinicella sp. W31]MDC2875474.1 LysR family transcriptional regulator [Marinicella sp. W31]
MEIKMRQLEAFRAVVKLASVSGAARTLGLSQPTVSNLITSLEAELGVQLFQRVKKRLVPTTEGLSFSMKSTGPSAPSNG